MILLKDSNIIFLNPHHIFKMQVVNFRVLRKNRLNICQWLQVFNSHLIHNNIKILILVKAKIYNNKLKIQNFKIKQFQLNKKQRFCKT